MPSRRTARNGRQKIRGRVWRCLDTVRDRYLQDAEDITDALDALYERARVEKRPIIATDVPEGMWSRAQGCLRGQVTVDAVQYCRRVAGVPTHLIAQKSFYVVIRRAGDQVEG